MQQPGVTVWFTGLSSAGKTTVSRVVASELRSLGYQITVKSGRRCVTQLVILLRFMSMHL